MGKTPFNIWIKIEGDIVQDGKIEIVHYAKILLNYQKIMQVLQETVYPKAKKGQFKLYLTNIQKGSSISLICPQLQTNVLTSDPLYNEILDNFRDLLESLLQGNELFITELESQIKDPSEKLKFLKPVRELLSKRDYRVFTGFSIEKPRSYIIFPADREDFVDELIKKYTQQASVEIKGIIIRQFADEPRRFVIKTLDGEIVTVYHSQESENYVHSLFLRPVVAKGILNTGIRKKEFEELLELTPFTNIEINSLESFDFKIPLACEVKYFDEDSLWCVSNNELSITGCDETFDGAMGRFEKNLLGFIIGVTSYSEKSISVKSKEIREKLRRYLEIDKFSS